jgi:hypothetical protein
LDHVLHAGSKLGSAQQTQQCDSTLCSEATLTALSQLSAAHRQARQTSSTMPKGINMGRSQQQQQMNKRLAQ